MNVCARYYFHVFYLLDFVSTSMDPNNFGCTTLQVGLVSSLYFQQKKKKKKKKKKKN